MGLFYGFLSLFALGLSLTLADLAISIGRGRDLFIRWSDSGSPKPPSAIGPAFVAIISFVACPVLFRLCRKCFAPKRVITPRSPFLQQLGVSNIYIIAATDSEGIEGGATTPEQLLSEVRGELKHDEARQKAGYHPFIYTDNGERRRLPFFTDQEHLIVFCKKFFAERKRIFPLMSLEVNGSVLFGKLAPMDFDMIVMNDKNPDERTLTSDEVVEARRMWER